MGASGPGCSEEPAPEATATAAEPAAPAHPGVAATLATAALYSCAIRERPAISPGEDDPPVRREVVCWGRHPRAGDAPGFAVYEELAGAVQIAASEHMLCGRWEDGTVRCNRLRFGRGGYSGRMEIARVGTIDDAVSVVTGDGHACVRHAGGGVSCWGQNDAGQLGDGGGEDRRAPVSVPLDRVTALAAHGDTTCAVADGQLVCWGRRIDGPGSEPPTPVASDVRFTTVALGSRHRCALDDAGVLHCAGVAALGATDPPEGAFEELTSGDQLACARGDDGWVCWGPEHRRPPAPVAEALAGATEIAVGASHGCFVVDGEVSCWGDNARGQVVGAETLRRPVSRVVDLDDAVAIGATAGGRCALRRDGRVVCWGRLDPAPWDDDDDEDVDDDDDDATDEDATSGAPAPPARTSTVPVAREGVEGAVELATGSEHGCARTEAGELRCWGSNRRGQLGIPDVTLTHRALPVPGIAGVRAVCAAASYTCVLDAEGTVRCVGQAGEGAYHTSAWVPVRGVRGAEEIACGYSLACARVEGGDVLCWRDELRRDTRALPGRPAVPVPARPPTARRFASDAGTVFVGDRHACVRGEGRPLACFGYGDRGVLGVGRCGDERAPCVLSREPVAFPGAEAGDAVFLGAGTCLRRGDGAVRCWRTERPLRPDEEPRGELVEGTEGAVGFVPGCALFADGHVSCWGGNRVGEVGDGTAGRLDVPHRVRWPEG